MKVARSPSERSRRHGTKLRDVQLDEERVEIEDSLLIPIEPFSNGFEAGKYLARCRGDRGASRLRGKRKLCRDPRTWETTYGSGCSAEEFPRFHVPRKVSLKRFEDWLGKTSFEALAYCRMASWILHSWEFPVHLFTSQG